MIGVSVHTLARVLGGIVLGPDRILVPGPGHSRKDRSLLVSEDSRFPDGFLVHSFAGDDWQICRDYVREATGLSARSPQRDPTRSGPRARIMPVQDDEADRRVAWKQKRAAELWEEAGHPAETLVQDYLTRPENEGGRGLIWSDDDVFGHALRFHPAMPWKENGRIIRVPGMVAAFRCIHTDKLVGVLRTRLTPDGRKVERRMLGDATNAAIKLDSDDIVAQGLTIGEGIETVLAAREMGCKPAWALGPAGALGVFPVLPGIEALTLLAEDDANGANARAVKACAARWIKADREVFKVASRYGGDINDALVRKAG